LGARGERPRGPPIRYAESISKKLKLPAGVEPDDTESLSYKVDTRVAAHPNEESDNSDESSEADLDSDDEDAEDEEEEEDDEEQESM
jgi:hypothetical protein